MCSKNGMGHAYTKKKLFIWNSNNWGSWGSCIFYSQNLSVLICPEKQWYVYDQIMTCYSNHQVLKPTVSATGSCESCITNNPKSQWHTTIDIYLARTAKSWLTLAGLNAGPWPKQLCSTCPSFSFWEQWATLGVLLLRPWRSYKQSQN